MNHMKEVHRPRCIAFVASMGALGNVLALLSLFIAPIHPQVALDLSHLGTFISAMYCGPGWGFVTGAIVALAPFYKFGVIGWYGPLFGSLIIPGKAITGLSFGLLVKRFRPFTSAILGFIPEFLYLYVFLKYLTVIFLPNLAGFMTDAVIISILTKAWFEIFIMGFIIEAIYRKKLLAGILRSIKMK
jgi:riboflavin transporter FmnP